MHAVTWAILLGALLGRCEAHGIDYNATIGLLMPVVTWSNCVDVKWLQWSAASVLAIHHINKRNATVVGQDTLSRIPLNFKVSYKFANSGFAGLNAAAATYQWKQDAGARGFIDDTCARCNLTHSRSVTEVMGLYEARDLTYPDAFVGCAHNDAATIVSTISSLEKIPLMGFAANATELADKTRYPYFSRTNPGANVNARAVVGVAYHFGWKTLNIIAVDNNVGKEYISDITAWAHKDGISVSTSQSFIESDEESIKQSVYTLSASVHNTSAFSRSHITVLVGAGASSLQYIIKYALEYKLLERGFVWMMVLAPQVEITTAAVDAMDKADFRRYYAGFLNIAGVQTPMTLRNVMADDPDTTSKLIWNRELAKAGKIYEKQSLENPANVNQTVEWAKVAIDGSIASGFETFFVYDAVWATAIGLAAAKAASDMDNIHTYCRSGGGKGPFQGASGSVTFDLKSGERAPLGIAVSVQNLIPPDNTDWGSFRYQNGGWVTLGLWEEGSGFVQQPVTPYWPGGQRTWNPAEEFPASVDTSSAQSPTSPADQKLMMTPTEMVDDENGWNSRDLSFIIFFMAALVGGVYSLYRYLMAAKVDAEEHSLQISARLLRQRLSITKEDGYALSTENTRWTSRNYITIPKLQMEAAVRLSRFEDFDIILFDAFSLLIAGNTRSEATRMYSHESRRRLLSSLPASRPSIRTEGNVSQTAQQELLHEWLLEHASVLLGLGPETPDVLTPSLFPASARTNVLDQSVNDHTSKCTSSLNSSRSHLIQMPELQDATATHPHTNTRTVTAASGRGTPMCLFCPHHFLRNQSVMDQLRTNTMASTLDSRSNNTHRKRGFTSSNDRFRYFQNKLMALRLWRDDSCALFAQLKVHVQVHMDKLAEMCHVRVREFLHDEDGRNLCNFCWSPDRGEFCKEVLEAVVDRPLSNFRRQDDREVGAVTVHEGAWREHVLECRNPRLRHKLKASGLDTESDESVFITQLHRRARLLDRPFKSKIIDMLTETWDCSLAENPAGDNTATPTHTHTATPTTGAPLPSKATLTPPSSPERTRRTWTASISISEGPKMVSLDADLCSLARNEAAASHEGIKEDHLPSDDRVSTRRSSGLSVTASITETSGPVSICVGFFGEGPANLEIFCASIKTPDRMRAKIGKYIAPHPACRWPLTANIMDPVRVTLVCSGPNHLLQTVRWFVASQAQSGLTVSRIKNKFLLPESEVQDGYRDVTINVVFEDESGLKIIGEIQVQDRKLHDLKYCMHKLYKVKRANNPNSIT
eukprot:CAMPEP_0179406640 /NCGR_PEP_ID=MMETSP0799-20121207/1011_1 /TAXON_ID=46947 /ORGANISM="Geminigera cryophila, Strain CCMP2564" /LENGTH=1271 /DNA_ID=CAMNT_0021177735 /DNA_START=198 /DNA_END=4013 /DNA_ORIENTATION=+